MRTKVLIVDNSDMAKGLARAFVDAGVGNNEDINVVDFSSEPWNSCFYQSSCEWGDDVKSIIRAADVIVFNEKISYSDSFIKEIKRNSDLMGNGKVFFWIVEDIHEIVRIDHFGWVKVEYPHGPIVTLNPATLVGAPAIVVPSAVASGADLAALKRLFEAVGVIHVVDKQNLLAATEMSICGLASTYMVIEAMADGGVRSGLPRDVAMSLAAQTVLGAAKMVLQTGKHPEELKDEVPSARGATIAAVHELEKAGTRAAFINAMYAATKRREEKLKPYWA